MSRRWKDKPVISGLAHPLEDSPGRSCVCVSNSVVSDSLCNPMDCSSQTLLSMEFSRLEHWSGLPFPSLGDLPNPWIKPRSPALQANFLPSEPPGKRQKSLALAGRFFTTSATWEAQEVLRVQYNMGLKC